MRGTFEFRTRLSISNLQTCEASVGGSIQSWGWKEHVPFHLHTSACRWFYLALKVVPAGSTKSCVSAVVKTVQKPKDYNLNIKKMYGCCAFWWWEKRIFKTDERDRDLLLILMSWLRKCLYFCLKYVVLYTGCMDLKSGASKWEPLIPYNVRGWRQFHLVTVL